MSHQPSKRMAKIQTPMIPVVGEWTAKHPGTISLGQGVVHYSAPTEVHQAVANAAFHEPRIDRYALVRGTEELLDQIEQKVGRENGIDCQQQMSVVTAGSNMGFLNAILAIGDVGDEIILLSPYYFNHEMAIGIAIMPGSMFGVAHGCSLRIAYGALDAQTVAEGIGRLTRGLTTLL